MPERHTAAQWQDECERLAARRDAEIADLHWLDGQLLQALRSGSRQLAELLHRSIRNARDHIAWTEAELEGALAARDAASVDRNARSLDEDDDPTALGPPRWP
jgi:hypothetical protein